MNALLFMNFCTQFSSAIALAVFACSVLLFFLAHNVFVKMPTWTLLRHSDEVEVGIFSFQLLIDE